MISSFTFLLAIASVFSSISVNAAHSTGGNAILYSDHFGNVGENGTYDYVVIGGGTAGLTIAMRLAENESLNVAVIEAGDFYEKDNGNKSVIPAYSFSADVGTSVSSVHLAPLVDWAFLTEPQTALGDAIYHYPRGKCLGGSSARNSMQYHRGTVGSYEQWASEIGDDSYNFTSLLPYFRKSAHFTPANTVTRASNATAPAPHPSAFLKKGGPLQVSFPAFDMPFSSWALPAMKEVGIPTINDLSSGDLLGAQYSTFTVKQKDASRSSSESSYLQAAFASTRTNLKVYPRSTAKQVLFQNKTATGVRINTNGAEYILSANKEVILSGGAFASPQILMVSGVGPRDILEKYNIPVIANRPGVGQNMWDHVLFEVVYEVDVITQNALNDPAYKIAADQAYIYNATGMLTNAGPDVLAFEKLPASHRANLSKSAVSQLSKNFASDWPEVEYVIASTLYAGAVPGHNYASIFAAMVAPLSRGNLSISSNDTSVQPLINPGWFTNPADLEVAVQAFKRVREIYKAKVLTGVVVGEELVPGPSVQTDAEIRAYLLAGAATVYHASCTCKMGKKSDPLAVVDNKARVFGVSNLRVVDASSFPLLPPGHPQATVYALAEKIADEILKDL